MGVHDALEKAGPPICDEYSNDQDGACTCTAWNLWGATLTTCPVNLLTAQTYPMWL